MAGKVCIVIPAHSPTPSYYELVSFQQCFKILGKHPIYMLVPKGMDLSVYTALVPDFNVKYVDKRWLSSKLNYNKLKLSQYFYKLFDKYNYLLTYELDAFVFTDDLHYWCDKGYDYIGAPWFKPAEDAQMVGVGNSGFSLRRIKAMKEGLKNVYYIDKAKHSAFRKQEFIMKLKAPIFKVLRRLAKVKSLFYKENTTIQKAQFLYEDKLIFDYLATGSTQFKLAPADEAYRFSFEMQPERLYELNNNNLPTGCHAWWQYNLPFWKPFIENYGYKL